MEGARGNHDPYQAFLPWGPNRTISSPKMAAAAPPKTYHMVSWVNLPVNVLLSWSAAECDAFLPTIRQHNSDHQQDDSENTLHVHD